MKALTPITYPTETFFGVTCNNHGELWFAENCYDDLYYGYLWAWIKANDPAIKSKALSVERAKELYDLTFEAMAEMD